MKSQMAKVSVTVRTPLLKLAAGQAMGITGSCPELGEWRKALIMNGNSPVFATITLEVSSSFEYKFVVVDKATSGILDWEEGANRYAEIPRGAAEAADGADSAEGNALTINASPARINAPKWRGAGTAIPVFSLRSASSFGIGEFNDLRLLVDWAVRTGQTFIQLLPINDTTMTGTWRDSYPYNANSSFALHPQFLHLPDCGVAEDEEYTALRDELNALPTVDYEKVNSEKTRLLRKAFRKTGKRTAARADYKQFIDENGYWLYPYAAFRVLTDLKGTPDFSQWGDDAKYSPATVERLFAENPDEMNFHCFEQFHLYRQFAAVKQYAHDHGVMLKGDLPIGVSRTSADAWCDSPLFNLDSSAGAPPDAFSVQGQNWGFPTYNWERMSRDSYAWWKGRLSMMAKCFDAFRIDHILGFFRIWEIPENAVHGLLGHFNPALPYSAAELAGMGFDLSGGRYITPIMDEWALREIFGDRTPEVQRTCFKDGRLKNCRNTQSKVMKKFRADAQLRDGLLELIDDVLFVEDPHRKGYFHPRIAAQSTHNYRVLEQWQKDAYNRLYDDFFYRRHNQFWKENAMKKLPELLSATPMLACGEDLGMIPDCVPEVMQELQILSLEIQRMPKSVHETFGNPFSYPYLSVCTTSTHDMNPLRAWWEEDAAVTRQFYNEALGYSGKAPFFCEPWICERVVDQHLASPSMLVILPLQDWLSMDGRLRRENPNDERINVPAIPRHYWRYRMHLTLEQLLAADEFNFLIRSKIAASGR